MARGRFHILKNKWNKVLSYPSRSYSGRRQVPKKIEPKSQHYKAIVGVVATASKMMSKITIHYRLSETEVSKKNEVWVTKHKCKFAARPYRAKRLVFTN